MPPKNKLPINLLLRKDLPFAVFRLPGSNDINLFIKKDRVVDRIGFTDIDKLEGFVVGEFESYRKGEIFLLHPDWKIKNKMPDVLLKAIQLMPDIENSFEENIEVSETTYLEMAGDLITKLKLGNLQKVVLSRVISEEIGTNFTPEIFFELLENTYPTAFVYLFNLPGKGTWAGATPEVLLRVNETSAETVSLAGTKPSDKILWTEKEIDEQKIVTDSIADTLKELKIASFSQKGPETVLAGNIAHLKTIFSLPVSALKEKKGKLVNALHPTPAVCGLPKQKAFDLIKKTEQHERRFYTGFLGPVNECGKTDFFVNLRCAELGKEKINIYVGGGITAASIAEEEWEETVRKSRTLLSVVEKLKTFAQ
jgi:isochorismate synthase